MHSSECSPPTERTADAVKTVAYKPLPSGAPPKHPHAKARELWRLQLIRTHLARKGIAGSPAKSFKGVDDDPVVGRPAMRRKDNNMKQLRGSWNMFNVLTS